VRNRFFYKPQKYTIILPKTKYIHSPMQEGEICQVFIVYKEDIDIRNIAKSIAEVLICNHVPVVYNYKTNSIDPKYGRIYFFQLPGTEVYAVKWYHKSGVL